MNAPEMALTAAEQAKRNDLINKKPYVAAKLARISEMEARGDISPIIRLEKSYLCNFQCSHCSAEYYMDRHLKNVLKVVDTRSKMTLEDVRNISREADELGLARFVITGGEPLVMKDFDEVVAAIDPDRHYIVSDTNGWFLDAAKARHLKSIGVDKIQLSLDSFIEQHHDTFRNKPGSYKRVMRAIDASLEAGLNLILATVLVKGRARTQEFRDLCQFATDRGIGLYVSYAKPSGACSNHTEFVIDKEDADTVRELEKKFNVFTHMTPSYGSFKGCITVKGIITITSTMEVTPCPYIDMSLGNLRETSLKEILARGMRNPWLGPYRPDCLIGEDQLFIKLHTEKTHNVSFLPVRWGDGFSDSDSLPNGTTCIDADANARFDAVGRCIPAPELEAPVHRYSRHQFQFNPAAAHIDTAYRRLATAFSASQLPSPDEFERRIGAILDRLTGDPANRNITKGPWLPFMLPQATYSDIGMALESIYLPAIDRSLADASVDRAFINHCHSNLRGRMEVIAGSRHDQLLSAMSKEAVVGCYFPCLTEYSVPATLAQVNRLPSDFLLAGGFDTCAALMAFPEALYNAYAYSPLLWLAALAPNDQKNAGFYFEAYGSDLTFNKRLHFGAAAEYWASGIVILG